MDIIEILKTIAALLAIPLPIIVGLLVYIWNQQRIEIESLKIDMKNFKENYLDRFEKNSNEHSEIKLDNTCQHGEIKTTIEGLKTEIVKSISEIKDLIYKQQ